MPDQLRDIVTRMVEGGESEADIAAVIQRLSAAEPSPDTEQPKGLSGSYAEALRSTGIQPTPQHLAMNQRMTEGALGGGLSSAAPTAMGQAVQQFAPGVSKALKGGAERLYGGLLKAKDATIERFPNVVQDLLKARAPISQGGRAKVIGNLQKIGAEKDVLLRGADDRAMVPRATLRRGLDDSLDTAMANSDTPVKDMSTLAKIERELLPDDPGVLPSRADRIKSKLQSEAARGFLAAKMGLKVGDTAAKAKMAVSHEAKQALEAIEPKLGPVNAAYGSGKGQALALRDALKRTDKHSVIGMSDLIGAGVGGAVGGPGGGAAGVALMKLLNNPYAGSQTAIKMNQLSRVPHIDQATKAALLALLSEQE